ncbi:MAG: hypothetical protein OJJ54_03715 [Pseudonocardia sp.]|nr:hypothetical protein [Pseudonocardia sp.]
MAWYWYVVLAGLLIGLVCAGVVSSRTSTTYASEVTMILAPTPTADESIAYQGALLATERAKSYAPLLTTEALAGGVVRDLGLDMYPVELVGETSVILDPDTVLIKARVVDGSAERAQQIAGALSREFTRTVADLERNDPSNAPALTVKVVQPATFSDTPVTPDMMLNLILGAILGLLAGLAGALALNALRMPVRSPRDLAEVTRSPLLGVLRRDPASVLDPLAVATRPDSAQAEAYRRICAALTSAEAGSRGEITAVISPNNGDGRTSIVCNLAVALAQSRRRVVLVDCDLRNPRVGEMLGRPPEDDPGHPEAGVIDVLEGGRPLDTVLRPWGNGFLDVLTAGCLSSHPGGLLASDHVRHLLAELARRYDVVLLDTPPILSASEAVALARAADGVVLAVRHGRTGRREVHSVMEILEGVSAPVVGTILNQVPNRWTAAVLRPGPATPRSAPPPVADDGPARSDDAGTPPGPPAPGSTPTASPRRRSLNSAGSAGD